MREFRIQYDLISTILYSKILIHVLRIELNQNIYDYCLLIRIEQTSCIYIRLLSR